MFDKWEYLSARIQATDPTDELNSYGQDGWELVSATPVIPNNEGMILVHNAGTGPGSVRWSNVYLCFFKHRLTGH